MEVLDMARRGFLAEVNRALKQVAREAEQRNRATERARQKAIQEAERARKAEKRAAAQLSRERERVENRISRENERERKRLAKEAKELHVASMLAEADRLNAELNSIYLGIDTLLAATLEIDDFVDLESLKVNLLHPPFDRTDLVAPVPHPELELPPAEPKLALPPAPKGLLAALMRGKHEKAVQQTKKRHKMALSSWKAQSTSVEKRNAERTSERQAAEQERLTELEQERMRYAHECAIREEEANSRNKEIDNLIAGLAYGSVDAVQDYVSIVLSNSVYPEHFPVEHEFTFEPIPAELKLKALVPGPDQIPKTKAYKYTKSTDAITETTLSQKACKDRYNEAVQQTALRTLHEVFEADRKGIIKTISLEVGTNAIDPATGTITYIPFIAAAAERDSFLRIELANVVPLATLTHLGAAISKNPYGLTKANTKGIRKS